VDSDQKKGRLDEPAFCFARRPGRLVMVGVARGFPDFTIGLLEQLFGVGSVTVHVPAIGALGGLKVAVCLMGEAFGLGEVRVAAPQAVIVVILRKGEASSDTGKGDEGHPCELTWVHVVASVGQKYQKWMKRATGIAG
jgi:hypothetical protein